MVGNAGIVIAFISTLISGVLFLRQACTEKALEKGKFNYPLIFYNLHTLGLLVAFIYLYYAIFTHQFQYYYVYAHTSLSLPPEYLVSAFWAGQEGTFLLWALFTSGAGYILFKKEKELLSYMMPFILLGQLFLLLFLIMETPFFHLGTIPDDGMGLNPLLMDPWMVIHPPIVFIGYALLIFPFAYASAALWKKDWQKGFLRALPWATAGWLFLGAGILIGGAWAYRVLGWGGYWGWDPVENASLIPWLTGTALVHGLIVQKQKGLFIKSNMILAIITFVLVILATFLTRGGVMSEYSVHAFAETTLTYLIGLFIVVFTLIGFALYRWRMKDISSKNTPAFSLSRESSFALTMIILSVSALLVLLGTLSPLITGLWGTPSSVGEPFYLQTNAPIVLFLFLLLASCPLLLWKEQSFKVLINKLKLILITVPALLAIGYMIGITTLTGLLFLLAIYLALAVNLLSLAISFKGGIKYTGGYLAHVGLALLFVGIVGSTLYTESQIVTLSPGQRAEVFGKQFVYTGINTEEENNYLEIQVSDGNSMFMARPNIYTAGGRIMRSPDISRNVLRDLYISPIEIQTNDSGHSIILATGESEKVGDYQVTFEHFTFEQHSGSSIIEVGAVLKIQTNGITEEYVPMIRQDLSGQASIPVTLPEGETLTLEEIDADRGLAIISIEGGDCCPDEEYFTFEIKVKPLISFMIAGTVLLICGAGIATWRRFS
ncbi:MAG: heme lyase CcmF/NrfE family subunit [Bacillota bacterium]